MESVWDSYVSSTNRLFRQGFECNVRYLGHDYYNRGLYEKAEECYTYAYRITSKAYEEAEAQYHRAKAIEAQGKSAKSTYESAKERGLKAYRENPTGSDGERRGLYYQVLALDKLGCFDEAIAQATIGANREQYGRENRAWFWIQIARIYYTRENYAKTLEAANQGFGVAPSGCGNEYTCQSYRVLALKALHRNEEALSYAETGYAHSQYTEVQKEWFRQQIASTYCEIARLEYKQSDYKKANAAAKQGYDKAPSGSNEESQCQQYRIVSLKALDCFDDAMSIAKQASEVGRYSSSDRSWFFRERASLHNRKKEYTLAESMCCRALELNANNTYAYIERSFTRSRIGRFELAKADAVQAHYKASDNEERGAAKNAMLRG